MSREPEPSEKEIADVDAAIELLSDAFRIAYLQTCKTTTLSGEQIARLWKVVIARKLRVLHSALLAKDAAGAEVDLLERLYLDPDDRDIPNTRQIEGFLHCRECIAELKRRSEETRQPVSPGQYARLAVGWTPIGLQVWCERHDLNVIHIDFEGIQHMMRGD